MSSPAPAANSGPGRHFWAGLAAALFALLGLGSGVLLLLRPPTVQTLTVQPLNLTGNMRIESPAFAMGEGIPKEYTCDGRDVSPPLRFTGVPESAKSLALIVDDPDAPAGTWTHWTVWNIAPQVGELAAAWQATDGAVEGSTSAGRNGWGGPCPPSGTHRYFFKLFALDTVLDLAPATDAHALEAAMNGHVIDKAGIFGTYSR